jgi:cytoskeletal protein RodZ
VDSNQSEATISDETFKASLGESLISARKRRGLSREAVVQQTHIPAHYVQMLEDDDYRLISDRVYLLPFLRKYASFLEIDQDETAMRLLREVQRVDNASSPIRLDRELDNIRRNRRRNWTKPIMFSVLVAVIIGAYIAQSRHSDSDTVTSKAPSSPASVAAPSSPSKETIKPLPQTATHSISNSQSDSNRQQQTASGGNNSAMSGPQPVTQVIDGPATRPEPPNLPQRTTPGARSTAGH